MGPGSAVHREDALRRVRDTKLVDPKKEKGRMLRTSSLIVPIFSRSRSWGYIPTPPRATTKLFDATCVPTEPVTWR